MAANPDYIDEDLLPYEPFRRLSVDLRRAAETMPDAEVRYLIDTYYALQEARKAGANRLRASTADHEPNSLTQFLAAQVEALEGACNSSLQIIARRTRTGRWCMGIKGISGVLTSGLLASLDVRKAPSAASFWRFFGLDPSWVWLGKERAQALYTEIREGAEDGQRPRDLLAALADQAHTPIDGLLARVERQTRPRNATEPARTLDEVREGLTRTQLINALATRPWNASGKTLSWKLFDCLVKVQNRDDHPYYCDLYIERKRAEWQRNFAGAYAEQCREALKRNLTALQRPWYSGQYDPETLREQWRQGMSPSTWKLPESSEGGVPMLPPGRIELRARRIGVKQFLADLHYCLYDELYSKPPVPNDAQQARGVMYFKPPPGWQETE